ncbi:MAG: integrase arm-type DNA-binding domain-containing protein [Pseudomonadales bacterium]|nr:integrase arm-type DNA-binding domain-containing protein [Pseudomonadales bacterium]
MTTNTPKAKGLTDTTIKTAKPTDKEYKVSDGGGLYLLIKPNGGKYWRLKYRYLGKEKLLALGVYPEVSLKEARLKRDVAKKRLENGTDPSEAKKEEKRLSILQSENTFEAIANEWLSKRTQVKEVTVKGYQRYLAYAFTAFGHKPVNEVTSPDVLALCRTIEARGTIETAHRVKTTCGLVFRYAIATGRATYEPTQALRGALEPVITNHQAAITDPSQVARLMQDIQGYEGHYTVVYALKLAPLVFVRPSELRGALWADIDLEAKEWRYHVHKTKTEHIVPLSSQATKLLAELKAISSHSPYVFPSVRSNQRTMSENTINAALRRLGYTSEQMCGHGFRAMARTILDEVLGYPIEVIEMQLAHAVKDANGRAYNRTKYREQRHKMMQHWSDYLDGLQVDNVVAVKFGGVA